MPTVPSSRSSNHSVTAAMLAATVMIVLQVGGKTTRDALYLSQYGAERLPQAMGGAALLSIAGALAMAKLLSEFGPRRVVPLAYLLNACVFGVNSYWWTHNPRIAALGLYLLMGATGPLLVSGFWSLISERFNPHAAKQNIGRIASSAALGGMVGGVLAERVATYWTISAMLPVLAVLSCAGAAATAWLALPSAMAANTRSSTSSASVRSASRSASSLRRAPYLQLLAALVVLTSLGSGLLDFAFKAEVARSTDSAEQMAAFFASFHAVVGMLTFAVQTGLTQRILQRLGLGGTLAILPACMLVSGILASAAMRLWTLMLVKGLDTTLKSSLHRASYELLYTPLASSTKRATKTLIDVAADRAGDIAAAAAISLLMFLFPHTGARGAVLLAAASAFFCLGLAMKLHQGYIQELTRSLRSGIVSAEDISTRDATTEKTLTDTTMALDREQLLREIRKLQEEKQQPTAPREISLGQRQILQRIEQLQSDTPQAVLALLQKLDLQAQLLPWIVPLLAERQFKQQARSALQTLGAAHTGQLVDALLDPNSSAACRASLPRVLEHFPTTRVRDGLLSAMADPEFLVRYKTSRSLLRLVEDSRHLAPSSELIYQLVDRETRLSPEQWVSSPELAASRDSQFPQAVETGSARLRYVITLLSCHLEREPLQLCLRAFSQGRAELTDTAHEYLENVLPTAIYQGLCPHLAAPKAARRNPRDRQQIARDLSLSAEHNKKS